MTQEITVSSVKPREKTATKIVNATTRELRKYLFGSETLATREFDCFRVTLNEAIVSCSTNTGFRRRERPFTSAAWCQHLVGFFV